MTAAERQPDSSQPDLESNAFQRGIDVLKRVNDPELLAAYTQYVEHLQTLLSPAEFNAYAEAYQRERRQVTHQAAGTQIADVEQAALAKVAADPEVDRLYSRYLALLADRKMLDSAYERPPLGASAISVA